MPIRPGIFVHGGAGSLGALRPEELASRRAALKEAARRGFGVLMHHGAVDAVETAIETLEDSGVFNAGKGSCLTLDGRLEMDAGIMDGKDLATGAITRIIGYPNPIRVARRLMERSDHVLMVGDDDDLIAKLTGLQPNVLRPSATALARWQELRGKWQASEIDPWPRHRSLLSGKDQPTEHGTVGAIALDSNGNVAAGVSTGGRWLKLRGRVGDSAIVGAGFYADNNAGAAAATGMGEEIMKMCLSKAVADGIRQGLHPRAACQRAIGLLTERRGSGTAGVIAVDGLGRLGSAFNTEIMGRAYFAKGMTAPVVRFWPDRSRDAKRPHTRLLV